MTAKSTHFHSISTVNAGGTLVDLSVPGVMGILNCTPDSFFDGGKNNTVKAALESAASMLEQGATFIDIGGYSSRPGAEHISLETERERVLPVIRAVIREFPSALLSIDTFRAEIASAAIQEGAVMVNDISGGEADPAMYATVAQLRVPYILMHMKGTPQTMVQESRYADLFGEVFDYFIRKTAQLRDLGVVDILLDPGFGFAKTRAQSFQLLNRLDQFSTIGLPLLAGVSRKSMVYTFLETSAAEALNGTTVLNTIALLKGASLLRVHDVKEAVEAVKLVSAIGES